MKVLFASKLDFGLRIGGVQNQVRNTMRALNEKGVEVVSCDPWADSLEGVDICHLFTSHSSLFPFAKAAHVRRIPLVISPILNFSAPLWRVKLAVNASARIPGFGANYEVMKQMLQLADRLLPLAEQEGQMICKVFGCDPEKTTVVPNGASQRFAEATDDTYLAEFGRRPDVLYVGRIDREKNVLRLIEALHGTGLHLAIIGFADENEKEYYERCRRAADENVFFVGRLAHDEPLLASAYASSRVYAQPSIKEVMPLTVLEAVLAGCRIALTSNSVLGALLGDRAEYMNPRSVSSIKRAVLAAGVGPAPEALRQYLLEEFTWEKIALQLIDVYEELLP